MHNSKITQCLVAALIVVLVGAGVCLAYTLSHKQLVEVSSVSPVAQGTPVAPPKATVFENEYMKLAVPAGWLVTESSESVEDLVYDKNTGKTTASGMPLIKKTGAVNISKGNYILYINPNAKQASGVTGGRFAEIAQGAPSADAVVTEQPSLPCGTVESYPELLSNVRKDLYVSSAEKDDYCAVPTNGKNVWYFSYITDQRNGYFNYYKSGNSLSYVITMAYNTKDVNTLPEKGTPALTTALTAMTDIVKTLELKELTK